MTGGHGQPEIWQEAAQHSKEILLSSWSDGAGDVNAPGATVRCKPKWWVYVTNEGVERFDGARYCEALSNTGNTVLERRLSQSQADKVPGSNAGASDCFLVNEGVELIGNRYQ